jgi:S1-C subfamily serine protease
MASTLLVGACGDDARPTGVAYRLVVQPCQGSVANRASAAAVAPDLLATVAHTLEGARTVEVADSTGHPVDATVVYVDPAKDIALLAPRLPLPGHLDLGPASGEGPVGILSYAQSDGPEMEDGEIIELVDVTLDGEGRRAAIRLSADIDPGDSGAAVLDPQGRMVGMVFATARNDATGWAVASTEIEAAIATVERSRPGAGLPAC